MLIWKSTAAAPTPIRLGPAEVPWAFMPWQEEQVSAKIALPWAMSAGDGPPGVAADAAPPAPVTAAYTRPMAASPSMRTAYRAARCLRRRLIPLTCCLGSGSGDA